MRRIFAFLLLVLIGCNPHPSSDKTIISVSILPQKYFVEKIAGNMVDINVLVPPGASPELYSLMPSQMQGLARSAAWLRIGKIGFEEGWLEKIRQSIPDLKLVDTSARANWITEEKSGTEEHGHSHGTDPHIWMAPDEVKKIAGETYKALLTVLPEQKETLTTNYNSFLNEIDKLDDELKSRFGHMSNKKFLIFHPSLTYLAREYGLEQIPIEVEGKEPSPRYMSSVVELAKKENIKMILIQKEFDQDNARQLANEITGKVVQIDPLNENWEQQLREISKKITGSLNE